MDGQKFGLLEVSSSKGEFQERINRIEFISDHSFGSVQILSLVRFN